jgi:hypothetical protein
MSHRYSTASALDLDMSSPLITSMLFGRESIGSSGGIPMNMQDPHSLRGTLRSRPASVLLAPPPELGRGSRSGSSSGASSRTNSFTSLATLAEERERRGSDATLVSPPMPIPVPGSLSAVELPLAPPPAAVRRWSTYTPEVRSKLSSSYNAEAPAEDAEPTDAPPKPARRPLFRRVSQAFKSFSLSGKKKKGRGSIPPFDGAVPT